MLYCPLFSQLLFGFQPSIQCLSYCQFWKKYQSQIPQCQQISSHCFPFFPALDISFQLNIFSNAYHCNPAFFECLIHSQKKEISKYLLMSLVTETQIKIQSNQKRRTTYNTQCCFVPTAFHKLEFTDSNPQITAPKPFKVDTISPNSSGRLQLDYTD